jgi:outer membrane protein, heavy metal efflux system
LGFGRDSFAFAVNDCDCRDGFQLNEHGFEVGMKRQGVKARVMVGLWVSATYLLAAWAGAAQASATTPHVSLGRAFEAAWLRAVENREVAGLVRRARASEEAAAALTPASPALEFSQRSDRVLSNRGLKEQEIGVALPLWWPGQKAAAGAAAASELTTAAATEVALRLKLAGEVRESAWQVTGALAESERAGQQDALLKRLADDVERRVAAGDLARADALAAQAEWLEASSLATAAAEAFAGAKRRWTLLTGLHALPDVTDTSPALTPAIEALAAHPEARRLAEESTLASRRLDFARASRREPLELQIRVNDERPAFSESAQRSIALTLRVPLGSISRNAPLLAAAAAERDLADARTARETERLAIELAHAQAAVAASDRQATIENQRARLLRERAQLVANAFQAGESPLPDLLRALAAANLADAAFARAQTQAGLARARLQQAQGLLP